MVKNLPPAEDEPGAEERFERGIRNALATPPKPHKAKDGSEQPKPRNRE
jgi:hypothetical protein